VNFIRSSIQECILSFPGGDSNRPGAQNKPYPFNPTSSYLTDADTDGDFVRNIRCPGNPGTTADHSDIFSGSSGKFMPPPPGMFGPWQYWNGLDGVFFFTATNKSDAFLQTAMDKLDDQFSECEADVIDAPAEVALTSTAGGGEPKCLAGETCFRVWVLTTSAAQDAYNGDTDSDEAACP
jgi:hypothetical protein